jgi:hypothetical protein
VAQIMKVQILDAEKLAGTSEGGARASSIEQSRRTLSLNDWCAAFYFGTFFGTLRADFGSFVPFLPEYLVST